MRISIVIPAHNEEAFLPSCLAAIDKAADTCEAEVETIVVLNRCADRTEDIAIRNGCRIVREEARNLSRIRNVGAAAATGEILVTVDADSRMSPGTLREVASRIREGREIGGATLVLLERFSVGIAFSTLTILPYLLRNGLSFGLFWCRKADFDAIGGFDESLVTVEDLDFRRRLKQHGRSRGKRFGTIWRSPLTTSCRKFDQFGDWFLFRNPGFLKRVFTGRDSQAADSFWYEARSSPPTEPEKTTPRA